MAQLKSNVKELEDKYRESLASLSQRAESIQQLKEDNKSLLARVSTNMGLLVLALMVCRDEYVL